MPPLYSSFSTSQYHDEPVKKPEPQKVQTQQEYKKPHQPTNEYGLTEQKRKSLYEQAQQIATSKSEYKGPDFRTIYRVGQRVMIQSPSGMTRTANGRIAEIVDSNLMYVLMEDTYKDVNGNFLLDFVTDQDIITKLV